VARAFLDRSFAEHLNNRDEENDSDPSGPRPSFKPQFERFAPIADATRGIDVDK
jgi:hypothetical protein